MQETIKIVESNGLGFDTIGLDKDLTEIREKTYTAIKNDTLLGCAFIDPSLYKNKKSPISLN